MVDSFFFLVVKQLKYLNMEETVKVRKLGYPIRYHHDEFQSYFQVLGSNLPPFSGEKKRIFNN